MNRRDFRLKMANLLVGTFLMAVFLELSWPAMALAQGNADALSYEQLDKMNLEDLLSLPVQAGSRVQGLTVAETLSDVRIITAEEIQATGARNLPELISLL